MLTSTDLRLIERFCQGDRFAFDALVRRHRPRVFNLVYRMTGDREWAEDITVEVFVEAYVSLPRFKQRAKFSTWLHRLAVNVCLEHIRHRKGLPQFSTEPLANYQAPPSADPAMVAMNKDLAERITLAMQALPETQRVAIIMYYLEERTCGEIANILGIPRNTAKTRIFHGTRILRDRLRAEGIVPAGR